MSDLQRMLSEYLGGADLANAAFTAADVSDASFAGARNVPWSLASAVDRGVGPHAAPNVPSERASVAPPWAP